MALPPYHHGILVTEAAARRSIIATVATAVIGLVATAPDGSADAFPLDRPVLIKNLTAAIEAAGETGTLRPALEAIASQVRTPVVVVRVAPGADAEATEAAVIGTSAGGQRTGIQALLTAESQVGVRPRILVIPGLETAATVEALAVAAAPLRAMAYARALGDDMATVAAFRAGFTQRELMLLWPDFTMRGSDGGSVDVHVAAIAAGARAAIDQTQGWHKTISNVPLAGVNGATADVTFDLQDPDCDANQLNADQVTTIVRMGGELRFWGSRTCAGEAARAFAFESATRTAHILADTVAAGLVWAIDKPLTPSLVRDVVEEINEKLRAMTRAGELLGAVAQFDRDANPTESLAAGIVKIGYRYTPVPPLESMRLVQEISDEFVVDLQALASAA